jgi:hypothetical protein
MIVADETVNGLQQHVATSFSKKAGFEKKPGSFEPGLRYWPIEADTITFQEG